MEMLWACLTCNLQHWIRLKKLATRFKPKAAVPGEPAGSRLYEGFDGGNGCGYWAKVLQAEMAPEFRPLLNQLMRCSELPWVKVSG
jgi:hypothetical protein